MAASDARPVPKKNTAFRLYFDIRKNDGTLITTWAGQDTELSLDGGNYSDATNEATEIQTSGTGYIDLTAAEMNYDCVIVKTTVTNTGALPFVVVLYPEEAGDIRTDATQISGDSAAADNLEAACDGGSYNVGGGGVVAASVTGAVGSVTGAVGSVTGTVGSVASYGTLVADVATAVWAAGTRTLTSFGTLIADIWAGITQAALAKFANTDTGETTAAAGSVAKLAQGAAGMTAQDIWEYSPRTLTQSAAEIESVVRGSVLTIHRGDSLSVGITGLGSIVGRKMLWFTVKSDPADVDTASIVQIEESSGLLYLNGATAPAVDGEIRVDDEAAGDITIALAAVASAELAAGSYSYDIQWVDASDGVHTLSGGPVRVTPDVTRATS